MYLAELADTIGRTVDSGEDRRLLHLLYALLVRLKGEAVTLSDVHDAWAVWTLAEGRDDEFVVPYEALPENVQEQDRRFAEALAALARTQC